MNRVKKESKEPRKQNRKNLDFNKMELVKRFPDEIVRHIFSFGSFEVRAQKDKWLRVVKTRLPLYVERLHAHLPHLVEFFSSMSPKQRHRIFRRLGQCCCCVRHLARRPAHFTDDRLFPFHNRDDDPECNCACRFVMRRLCKAADFDLWFE